MLAGAIFFGNGSTSSARFRDTSIYLDTKFLLGLLGYAGDSIKAPRLELVDLLWASGATLLCFQHTYDEVESVLRGCAKNLRVNRASFGHGQTFEYLIAKNYSESDVLMLASRLERDLESLKIASSAESVGRG